MKTGRTPDESNRTRGLAPSNGIWLVAFIFLVFAFVAYQPVWRAGFIWDDNDHLTANPAMTAPHGLRMIWSSLSTSRYYPLTLTTFWVQHQLWGLNPLPYHLINVALHAISGFVLFLVLRRLRVPAAWLAAMLWVVHPVNVESVAWVTELKNTQSGLFFFLAILCFLKSDESKSWHWYASSLVLALAALLSKPSTVVLPMVLLLCIWWQRKRWQRCDLVRIVPYFAFSLGMSAIAILEQRGQILALNPTEWKLGLAQKQILAGKAIWFYAMKVLWPVHLTFVYPRWDLSVGLFQSWVPLVGLVAIGIVLWARRQQVWARATIFGLAYFVVALLPVLGIFDIFYFLYSFVADHFQYLASAGLIALVTASAARICDNYGMSGKSIGIAVASIAVLTLGSLTWKQSRVYTDMMSLWQDTLSKNPGCWMAEHNLANELLHQNDATNAIAHWQRAIEIKPDFIDARNNLGTVLFQNGRITDAIEQWQEVLRIKPDDFSAHLDLGTAQLQLRNLQEGMAHFERAVAIKPQSAQAHFNLGVALQEAGNDREAIVHFERTVQIQPSYLQAYLKLGKSLENLGMVSEAIKPYESALDVQPEDYEAQLRLGLALAQIGKGRDAVSHLETAVRIKPDSVQGEDRLAWLLATLPETEGGNPARALELAQRIGEATGHRIAICEDTLAAAYAANGRFSDATSTAQKALEMAKASGQLKLMALIEKRLQLYLDGHPNRLATNGTPSANP